MTIRYLVLLVILLTMVFPFRPENDDIFFPGSGLLIAHLTGVVVNKQDGSPISGARIDIPTLGITGYSDADGQFSWKGIPIPRTPYPITVNIETGNHGRWTLQDVRLIAGDTLILTPRLRATPYLDIVPPPRAINPSWSLPDILTTGQMNALPLNHISVPRPDFIRVRVSGWPYDCDTTRDYTVEVIEFKQYVRNVIPNEWNPEWHENSLRAGAMAVKMYAWSVLSLGYKWNDADVWDSTCDQVYNPNFEYESTNQAIDVIWDWVLGETNDFNEDILFHTSYRAWYYQCEDAGKEGRCMGQWDSKDLAEQGYDWTEILAEFYWDSFIRTVNPRAPQGYTLRYNGSAGDLNENRVLMPVDFPDTDNISPPIDVGAEDFTIEWWMKATADENIAPAIQCGPNDHWNLGNIIIDRDRANQDRWYGVSMADGNLAFGVSGDGSGDYTMCGNTPLTDEDWHHIAVQRRRSDGHLWMYVDGSLDIEADGPDGDISFPDAYTSTIESDSFMALAAWKQDTDQDDHPFFRGWIDELRFSNLLRYQTPFTPTLAAFIPDQYTLALFHFDDGVGNLVFDTADGQTSQNHGNRKYGGVVNGPEWEISTAFSLPDYDPAAYLPIISR